MYRPFLVVASLVALGALAPSGARADEDRTFPERGRVAPHQLIVRLRPGASGVALRTIERRCGVRVIEESTATGALLVEPARGVPLARAFSRLVHEPSVADVSPNSIAHAASPDDPYFYLQWNLEAVDAYEGDRVPDATNVTIAIVDTGIAADAPDLTGVAFAPGYDFVNDDEDATDDHQHGTHLAGIIAQATDNGRGTAGLAVGATLMPIKVLDAHADGDEFTIMDGIASAAADGADIINLSFEFGAGYRPSRIMEDVIRDALDAGSILVAAAGNSGIKSVSYPAAFRGVLAVGAAALLDEAGNIGRAHYSNYGPELDLLAPGGSLNRDVDGDGIPEGVLAETFDPARPHSFEPYLLEGTSGAAAHVSAAAALLIAGGTPRAEVAAALVASAQDLGAPGFDLETGAGLLDATPDEVPAPPPLVPTAEVLVSRTRTGCSVNARARVTIRTSDGESLRDAAVFGRWSGSVTATPAALSTDRTGRVTFVSPTLLFTPDGPRGQCTDDVDRGTLFMFAVDTVVSSQFGPVHPTGHLPDGWFVTWFRPGRGAMLRGAGLVLPPTGLDYVDGRPARVARRMDAQLLEPFGLVFGQGGHSQRNELGPIRGGVFNPYTGDLLAVHDADEAEQVLFSGGGNPDPGNDPIVEEVDAEWESFSTGVAVFSRGALVRGGGNPDPGNLPGAVSLEPDAPVMVRALGRGTLATPPVPLATDAARMVPLSVYLEE